jgi:hypothetical protein
MNNLCRYQHQRFCLFAFSAFCFVPLDGFAPSAFSLQEKRSTPELKGRSPSLGGYVLLDIGGPHLFLPN